MAPTRHSSLRSVGSNKLATYDLLHGLLKESMFAGRNIRSETSKESRSKLLNDALRSDGCDIYKIKKDKIKTGLDEQIGRRKAAHPEEEIHDDVKSDKVKRLVTLIQELLRYATMRTMRRQQSDRQGLVGQIKKGSSKIECLYNKNYSNALSNSRLSAENIRKIKRPVEEPRSQIEISRKYSDREKGGGCSNSENPDRPVSEQKRRIKSSGKHYIEHNEDKIIRPPTGKRPRSAFEEPCREKMSNRYSAKERKEDSHSADNVHHFAESTNTRLNKVSASSKKRSGTEFKVWGDKDPDHASRRGIERKEECAEGLCNCCYRCECPKSHRKDEDEEMRSFGDEIDREEREFLEIEEKRRKSEKNKSPEKEMPSERRRSSENKRRISSEKKLTPERKIPVKKPERIPYDDRISPENKIPSERRKSSERRRSHEKRKSPKRKISTPTKQLSDENTTSKRRSEELDDRQERRRSLDKRRSPRRSISKDENDESTKIFQFQDNRRKYDLGSAPEDKHRGSKNTSKEKHKKAKPNDAYIYEDTTENKKSKKEKERFESDISKRRNIIIDEFEEEQSQYSDDLDKNNGDEWDSIRPVTPKKEEPRKRRLSPEGFGPRVYKDEKEAEEKAWKSSKLSTIEEEQKSSTKRKQPNSTPRIYSKSQTKSGEHNLARDESCPFITHEKSLISSSYIDICNQYADSVADACVTEYDDAIHQICREFLEQALPGISFDYDSISDKYYNDAGNLNSLFGQSQWHPIYNSAL